VTVPEARVLNSAWPAGRPPGLPGLPLVGNGLRLARDPLGFLTAAGQAGQAGQGHGDVVRIALPGQAAFLVTSPELVEFVLNSGAANFVKSPGKATPAPRSATPGSASARSAAPRLPRHLAGRLVERLTERFTGRFPGAADGEHDDLITWLRNFPADREVFVPEQEQGHSLRQDRRQIGPAFHSHRIVGYADTMVDIARRVSATWRDGQELDVHHEMTRLSLAVVAKTLFGVDALDRADAVATSFDTVFRQMVRQLKYPVRLPLGVPTPGNLRVLHAVAEIGRFLDDVHREGYLERRHQPDGADGAPLGSGVGSHENLLDLLLGDAANRTDDAEPQRSGAGGNRWRHQALIVFAAGYETTAVALTWTWYLLAANPQVQERLHAELAAVLDGRAPEAADYQHLRYTEAVVKESLRLYPPVWLVGPRTAREDLMLGGYRIPADGVVLVSPWVIHRDRRNFAQPNAFDPGRWLDARAEQTHRYAYLPFSAGPRLCVGHRYAMTETVLVLATLAQRSRMGLLDVAPPRPQGLVTLQPPAGLRLRVHGRPEVQGRPRVHGW